jgi:hypothetical protein
MNGSKAFAHAPRVRELPFISSFTGKNIVLLFPVKRTFAIFYSLNQLLL